MKRAESCDLLKKRRAPFTARCVVKNEKKFPCPCCGYLTLSIHSPGTFEIYPVCNWGDDAVQFDNIDFEEGVNKESLKDARLTFKKIGDSSLKFLKLVRAPISSEIP